MSSFCTIPLKKIWSMLKVCAPGHTKIKRDHNWLIAYGGSTCHGFPRGGHKKKMAEIELGHVRQLIRHLGIEECATREIEALR